MTLSSQSFLHSDMSTDEVEASELLHGALVGDIRGLVDVAIRTQVEPEQIAAARELIQQAALVLGEDAAVVPAGIRFNTEGRVWNWGNAVVGVRNAIAPPVVLRWGNDGAVRSEVDLGVAYEGPPGCVHGGVSALLLDHLMGETASDAHTRLVVTGTLNLRYLRPLPLGRIHLWAQITKVSGRKVTVTARIGPDCDGNEPAVEANGLFITPRWAHEAGNSAEAGSPG